MFDLRSLGLGSPSGTTLRSPGNGGAMGPGELSPRWRGVHHLALITPDMDATVRFWCGALGARLVATVATDAFRPYFFEFGPGSTIAFFEYRRADPDVFS